MKEAVEPLVVNLGPFSGGKITGFAEPSTVPVQFFVNNLLVTETRVLQSGPYQGQFFISCEGIYKYIGNGDTIRLLQDGIPIKFPDGSTELVIKSSARSDFYRLKKAIRSDFVLTKFGKLTRGWTSARRDKARKLYEDVSDKLMTDLGLHVVPSAGNLLGAVREGDFISHDAGAFDCVFVSDWSEPQAVRAQCLEVIKCLSEMDYVRLKVKSHAVFVTLNEDKYLSLDLKWLWLDDKERVDLSCGSRFKKASGKAKFFDFQTAYLGDWPIKIPGNAEEIVFQFYGENWNVPDQGFNPGAPQIRNKRYHLTQDELERALEFVS